MREPQLPARVREADLAVVHVAGDDEVERARGKLVDERGEVRDEDPQVGLVAPNREVAPAGAACAPTRERGSAPAM